MELCNLQCCTEIGESLKALLRTAIEGPFPKKQESSTNADDTIIDNYPICKESKRSAHEIISKKTTNTPKENFMNTAEQNRSSQRTSSKIQHTYVASAGRPYISKETAKRFVKTSMNVDTNTEGHCGCSLDCNCNCCDDKGQQPLNIPEKDSSARGKSDPSYQTVVDIFSIGNYSKEPKPITKEENSFCIAEKESTLNESTPNDDNNSNSNNNNNNYNINNNRKNTTKYATADGAQTNEKKTLKELAETSLPCRLGGTCVCMENVETRNAKLGDCHPCSKNEKFQKNIQCTCCRCDSSEKKCCNCCSCADENATDKNATDKNKCKCCTTCLNCEKELCNCCKCFTKSIRVMNGAKLKSETNRDVDKIACKCSSCSCVCSVGKQNKTTSPCKCCSYGCLSEKRTSLLKTEDSNGLSNNDKDDGRQPVRKEPGSTYKPSKEKLPDKYRIIRCPFKSTIIGKKCYCNCNKPNCTNFSIKEEVAEEPVKFSPIKEDDETAQDIHYTKSKQNKCNCYSCSRLQRRPSKNDSNTFNNKVNKATTCPVIKEDVPKRILKTCNRCYCCCLCHTRQNKSNSLTCDCCSCFNEIKEPPPPPPPPPSPPPPINGNEPKSDQQITTTCSVSSCKCSCHKENGDNIAGSIQLEQAPVTSAIETDTSELENLEEHRTRSEGEQTESIQIEYCCCCKCNKEPIKSDKIIDDKQMEKSMNTDSLCFCNCQCHNVEKKSVEVTAKMSINSPIAVNEKKSNIKCCSSKMTCLKCIEGEQKAKCNNFSCADTKIPTESSSKISINGVPTCLPADDKVTDDEIIEMLHRKYQPGALEVCLEEKKKTKEPSMKTEMEELPNCTDEELKLIEEYFESRKASRPKAGINKRCLLQDTQCVSPDELDKKFKIYSNITHHFLKLDYSDVWERENLELGSEDQQRIFSHHENSNKKKPIKETMDDTAPIIDDEKEVHVTNVPATTENIPNVDTYESLEKLVAANLKEEDLLSRRKEPVSVFEEIVKEEKRKINRVSTPAISNGGGSRSSYRTQSVSSKSKGRSRGSSRFFEFFKGWMTNKNDLKRRTRLKNRIQIRESDEDIADSGSEKSEENHEDDEQSQGHSKKSSINSYRNRTHYQSGAIKQIVYDVNR